MKKIFCFHKEHTAMQIRTLTHRMGKNLSHSFTISNQSIKGKKVTSSVFEQWMPTLVTEADPEEWEWEEEDGEDEDEEGQGP